MKKLFPFLFIIIFTNVCFAQNASTFFPSSPGYKWFYKNTPLDSLNNPQSSLATYQIDSFATNQNYQGLSASLVLSKSGLTNINQTGPYLDTNYYNFQSTNGFYYLNILGLIGSIPFFDSIRFVEFIGSFEKWYSTYRFAEPVNNIYVIFSKDTTLTLKGVDFPLRIYTNGIRLNDQTISTVNGNYLAKKFIITFGISYGLIPPILYVPVITQPDTVYIAENIWVVKESKPSTNVDLTPVGIEVTFSIPGFVRELTTGTTGIFQNNLVVNDFNLYQNYPNPFNPVTVIRYSLIENRFTTLKVFDALGKEVARLVNEKQNAGTYEVDFDGTALSGGIYFYKLETGDFVETKRMILLK